MEKLIGDRVILQRFFSDRGLMILSKGEKAKGDRHDEILEKSEYF